MQASLSDLEVERLLGLIKVEQEADWRLDHTDAVWLVQNALGRIGVEMQPERAMYLMMKDNFANPTEYNRALVDITRKFWLFLTDRVFLPDKKEGCLPRWRLAGWAQRLHAQRERDAIKSGGWFA